MYFNYMIITEICDDILNFILKECNIKCHTCNLEYNFNNIFYKKQNKFYYCSKECYDFI